VTTNATRRQQFCARFSGTDGIAFENAALSIGREFLPPCAVAVLDGGEGGAEYWDWLWTAADESVTAAMAAEAAWAAAADAADAAAEKAQKAARAKAARAARAAWHSAAKAARAADVAAKAAKVSL
jgi:hypothetical protein